MFSKHRHDKQKKNKKINKQTNHPRNLNDNFSSGPFFFTVDKLKVDVYLIGLFWRKKTSEFFLMFLAAVCLHSVIIQTRGWMNLLAIFPCRIYVHKKPWSLSRFRRARLVKSRGTLTAAISSKKLNAIEITLTIRHAPSNQILCDILPSPPSLLSLSLSLSTPLLAHSVTMRWSFISGGGCHFPNGIQLKSPWTLPEWGRFLAMIGDWMQTFVYRNRAQIRHKQESQRRDITYWDVYWSIWSYLRISPAGDARGSIDWYFLAGLSRFLLVYYTDEL